MIQRDPIAPDLYSVIFASNLEESANAIMIGMSIVAYS